jgi:E3 ubiquitin-protein ligase HUWE1
MSHTEPPCSTVVKLPSLYSQRSPDAAQKKQAVTISGHVQTLLLVTQDKKETDPKYFEPQDFLVKMRLAVLPFVRELWEAPWLVHAPLSVCKSVVQTMLELMAGENEEPKGESASDVLAASVGLGVIHRHIGPDENCICQLCDMGFPRSAAERALAHTWNNVSAATEYLLAQPLPFPPEPEPEAAPPEEATGETQASSLPSDAGTAPVDGSDEPAVDTKMAGKDDAEDSSRPSSAAMRRSSF